MSDSPSESHFQERWRDTVHRRVAGRAAGADLVDDARALSEAAAIVRDLAANEPLAEMNSDYPQYRYCLYCEANNAPGPGRPETSDPPGVVHADGCNWRKAVEWVERHD